MLFKPIRLGQVYRALADVKILGMVIMKATGSGGFYCTLPKGTLIVIDNEPRTWPLSKGAYAIPLNYKELERKLVPPQEIDSPLYKMYTLVPTFKDLKRNFVKETLEVIKFGDDKMQAYFDKRICKRRKNKSIVDTLRKSI